MEKPIIFKPLLWRLTIWRFVPFYLGWTTVDLIYKRANHYSVSLSFLLLSAFVILIAMIFGVLLIRKKFDILVSKGTISGPGAGLFLTTESFLIADLDLSYINKQSFYEKISLFRTIRSLGGQKIMIADFIYGRSLTNELYKILEQEHLQFNKS